MALESKEIEGIGQKLWMHLGPDRLCLLWEIAACYFPVVIYSLLFRDNSLLCR